MSGISTLLKKSICVVVFVSGYYGVQTKYASFLDASHLELFEQSE